ncbi:MAG: hypothetical protein ACWA41_07555 [Putridiphycobacter sp.]
MGRRIGTLGLVNYKDHPTDNRFKIFNFNSLDEANYFETLILDKRIKFEKDTEEVENKSTINLVPSNGEMMTMYLFAVDQRDFEKAQQANFLVSAKFRKPTINNKFIKWTLLLVFLGSLIFALIGYFISNSQ